MKFTDYASVSKPRKTVDGYLVAKVNAARTGIQTYTGAELGRPDLDTVRVYRAEDEVFDIDSLGSYKGKPVTLGHPSERVTSANHRQLARGHISGVARDGESVALDVAITDGETVSQIERGGPRELSVGYVADVDFDHGVTPNGESYDAVQRNIFVDHLAIVQSGRAGPGFRIGDSDDPWGVSPVPKKAIEETPMAGTFKTVVLGDSAARVLEADATLVETFKAAQAKRLADAEAAHAEAIAAKDVEIAELKKSIMTDADIDARVESRAKLIADAQKVKPSLRVDGMSDVDIMRAAVAHFLGDSAAAGLDKLELKGAFAVAIKNAPKATDYRDASPLADGIRDQAPDGAALWGKILKTRKEA